jgi:hypothetical protein
MERDFNNSFMPPYMDYNMPPPGMDMNEMMMQYEQGCSYYRYLCMQMDYKIKCKEYEKLCNASNVSDKRDRKIE